MKTNKTVTSCTRSVPGRENTEKMLTARLESRKSWEERLEEKQEQELRPYHPVTRSRKVGNVVITAWRAYVSVPNPLIDDSDMSHGGKMMAYTLLSLAKDSVVDGYTQETLAKKCGCCKKAAAAYLKALESRGWIKIVKQYRYCPEKKRLVYDCSRYEMEIPNNGTYTLIPKVILMFNLAPAVFAVLLAAYRCAGRKNRSFSSFNYISGQRKDGKGNFGISRTSVIRAIKILRETCLLTQTYCDCVSGRLSGNNYCLTYFVFKWSDFVEEATQDVNRCGIKGSTKNAQHSTNKIDKVRITQRTYLSTIGRGTTIEGGEHGKRFAHDIFTNLSGIVRRGCGRISEKVSKVAGNLANLWKGRKKERVKSI